MYPGQGIVRRKTSSSANVKEKIDLDNKGTRDQEIFQPRNKTKSRKSYQGYIINCEKQEIV